MMMILSLPYRTLTTKKILAKTTLHSRRSSIDVAPVTDHDLPDSLTGGSYLIKDFSDLDPLDTVHLGTVAVFLNYIQIHSCIVDDYGT